MSAAIAAQRRRSQQGQHDEERLDRQRERDVLADDGERAPGVARRARAAREVVGHEHDVGGLDRGVAAGARPWRCRDSRARERRRVVDAVAHHRHAGRTRARAPRRPDLVLGQQLGAHLVDAEPARRSPAAVAEVVAGEHDHVAATPARVQLARRARGLGARLVAPARSGRRRAGRCRGSRRCRPRPRAPSSVSCTRRRLLAALLEAGGGEPSQTARPSRPARHAPRPGRICTRRGRRDARARAPAADAGWPRPAGGCCAPRAPRPAEQVALVVVVEGNDRRPPPAAPRSACRSCRRRSPQARPALDEAPALDQHAVRARRRRAPPRSLTGVEITSAQGQAITSSTSAR